VATVAASPLFSLLLHFFVCLLFCSSLLLSFFLFLFFLFLCFFSCSLSLPLFSSFSSILLFLLFFFFLWVSPPSPFFVFFVPLLCLYIYRQRRAVKMPCLYLVRGHGRVDGGASWGLIPSVFFVRGRPPVRALGKWGLWVGIFLLVSKKEGTGKAKEKSLLLPLPRVSRGRRKATMPFKTAPFWAFPFFFF